MLSFAGPMGACREGTGAPGRKTRARHASFLALVLLMLSAGTALAQLELPPGLQAAKEYNQVYALEFIQNISIPLVFLAGVLSVLSPCILPLIPAFFSYTFKEKRAITKMTVVFFVGFSMVFTLMGIAASVLGQSVVSFQGSIIYLIYIAGLGLIAFGLLAFFGKGFPSLMRARGRQREGAGGIFMMGTFFALGWTACLGPVIAGILLVATALGNVAYAALLLFSYSLGIFTPLLFVSIFYDRLNIQERGWMNGREIGFTLMGRKVLTHTTSMLSGALLIAMGMIFLVFGGTQVINSFSPIGSSMLFSDMQRLLMGSPVISTALGLAVLVPLLAGLGFVLLRKRGKNIPEARI